MNLTLYPCVSNPIPSPQSTHLLRQEVGQTRDHLFVVRENNEFLLVVSVENLLEVFAHARQLGDARLRILTWSCSKPAHPHQLREIGVVPAV